MNFIPEASFGHLMHERNHQLIQLQDHLSGLCHLYYHAQLVSRLQESGEISDEARLSSVSTTSASSPFATLTKWSNHSHIHPAIWSTMIHSRVGIKRFLGQRTCGVCRQGAYRNIPELNALGHHASVCEESIREVRRHKNLRDMLYSYLRGPGEMLTVYKENFFIAQLQGPTANNEHSTW